MKKLLVLFVLFLMIQGCGYKPTSTYARKVLGSKVSVFVDIYSGAPENSVIIKDAVLEALVTRFGIITTKRAFSVTHLDVKLTSLREVAIQYDANGYVVARRETVNLRIIRTSKGVKKSYNVSGIFDFAIPANATVSEADRFKAIRGASLKAIDTLSVQLAVEGSLSPSQNKSTK